MSEEETDDQVCNVISISIHMIYVLATIMCVFCLTSCVKSPLDTLVLHPFFFKHLSLKLSSY